MARHQFTQKWIEATLRKPRMKREDYSDSATRGLSFRVGTKSAHWYFVKRIDGRLVKLKIGDWPTMSLAQARQRVGEMTDGIASGEHPIATEARRRSQTAQLRAQDEARLIENVSEAWLSFHLPDLRPQTQIMYRRAIRRIVGRFGGQDIGSIRRGDLIRFLDEIRASTKSGVTANHIAATLRLLFRYAFDRLELEHDPAAGLKNPAKVKARDRILNRAEIQIVWRACELAGYPWGHALRLQLCTGQRIGEIAEMRRSDVEDDYWRLSKNKTSKRIDIYLDSLSRAILKDCPDFGKDAPYFSASTDKKGGVRPLRTDTFANALERHVRPNLKVAADELGLPEITEHWTPHDLRRSVRSGLTGWAGVFPDIAERTINHAIGGIRATYDHADYRPHITAALQAWNKELKRILKGEAAKVIQFKQVGL